MKTKEDILQEIAIHEKTGAMARVKILKERLFRLENPNLEDESSPRQSASNTTEEGKGDEPIEENDTTAPPGVNPLKKIEDDHEEEMLAKRDEMAAELDKMKRSGLSWKEIAESTGVNAPWMAVKSWKKRQQRT